VYQKYVTFGLVDDKPCLIYIGQKFILEWYYDKNGKSVAYDYFLKTTREQRRKFFVLVKREGESNGNDI
jgi:hypothetical protein